MPCEGVGENWEASAITYPEKLREEQGNEGESRGEMQDQGEKIIFLIINFLKFMYLI